MSENLKETNISLLSTSNDDFMMILIDLIIFCHGEKDWKILSLVEGLGNPFTSERIFQFFSWWQKIPQKNHEIIIAGASNKFSLSIIQCLFLEVMIILLLSIIIFTAN